MSLKWKGLLLRNRSKTLMQVIDCTLRAVIVCNLGERIWISENLKRLVILPKSIANCLTLFVQRNTLIVRQMSGITVNC